MTRTILYAALIVLAAVAGITTYSWYARFHGGEAYGGPFELVDQHGDKITEQALRGHPSAIFFGFTHCPEVCPTTLWELGNWLEDLGEEGSEIRVFFISVDPERDTPDVLESYISNFSDRITGITGDPEDVAKMIKDFGIYAKKVKTDDGDYTMDHTASVILLDEAGSFFGTIAYGESAETAVAKLKRLAGETG